MKKMIARLILACCLNAHAEFGVSAGLFFR